MLAEGFSRADLQSAADAATAISAISVVIAVAAFFLTRKQHLTALKNFNETLLASYYSELDRMYFDLIAMRIGKPHLSDPREIQTRMQRQEYDQYAFLVWNFLETVYDRCFAPSPDKEKREPLGSTWTPVFEYEMALHRTWFDQSRHGRFKEAFCDHIDDYPQLGARLPAREEEP